MNLKVRRSRITCLSSAFAKTCCFCCMLAPACTDLRSCYWLLLNDGAKPKKLTRCNRLGKICLILPVRLAILSHCQDEDCERVETSLRMSQWWDCVSVSTIFWASLCDGEGRLKPPLSGNEPTYPRKCQPDFRLSLFFLSKGKAHIARLICSLHNVKTLQVVQNLQMFRVKVKNFHFRNFLNGTFRSEGQRFLPWNVVNILQPGAKKTETFDTADKSWKRKTPLE